MTRDGRIAGLAQDASDLQIGVCESSGMGVGDLAQKLQAVAQRALALIDELAETCEDEAFGDVAFVAGLQLRQRTTRVQRLAAGTNERSTLEACGSLRRHVISALVEIDRALTMVHGTAPALAHLELSETGCAREVRYAYLSFIRTIRDLAAQLNNGEIDHHAALRSGANNIAKLVGRSIFSELRVGDRRELRELQRRTLEWARSNSSDDLQARRLWQDISACAELLVGVQRRAVLMSYDLELIAEILRNGSEPTTEQRHVLQQIEGRSPHFDDLLASGASWRSQRLALTDLHDQLAAALGRQPLGGTDLVAHVS